jgi:hypothetical protein
VGSDQKIVFYKMLLEFDFFLGGGRMFNVKMPNSPKKYFFGPNILGSTPKFKIPLQLLEFHAIGIQSLQSSYPWS